MYNTRYKRYLDPLKCFHDNGFDTAIIAGGVCRDRYYDKQPRDIDIYVHDVILGHQNIPANHQKFAVNKGLTALWEEVLGSKNVASIKLSYKNYSTNQFGITGVWKLLLKQYNCYTNVEIISTTLPPTDHVNNNFNIGLCKTYYDGNKIRYTDDFMRDVNNQTLTVLGAGMSHKHYKHTMDVHVPKLQVKYPNHVVNHDHYSMLLQQSKNLQ